MLAIAPLTERLNNLIFFNIAKALYNQPAELIEKEANYCTTSCQDMAGTL